ncbi:hypothetical protein ACN28S_53195 [Cystobacter fuscus]
MSRSSRSPIQEPRASRTMASSVMRGASSEHTTDRCMPWLMFFSRLPCIVT